jgi:hypothetical protein
MPVVAIFDGFFRSGTTLVWNILKQSNPECLVFYEPLKPTLFAEIEAYRATVHPLHQLRLFDEYHRCGPGFIHQLQNAHKRYYRNRSAENLCRYLALFQALPDRVVLQTNRLGPYFPEVAAALKPQLYFLIRNLEDVLRSMTTFIDTVYTRQEKSWKQRISRGLCRLRNIHPEAMRFGGLPLIECIHDRFGIPRQWTDRAYRRSIARDPLRTFVLAWVLYNYTAFRSLNRLQGLFVYEDLVRDPERFQDCLRDLRLNTGQVRKQPLNLDQYVSNSYSDVVRHLGVQEEYDCIAAEVKKAEVRGIGQRA